MLNAKILDLEVVERLNNVSNSTVDFTRLFYMLYQEMDHLIRHADTKAQLVLGVNAVLAASSAQIAPGVAQVVFDGSASWMERAAVCFSVFMLVLLMGSIFFALSAVAPRMKVKKGDPNLYFLGHIIGLSEEEFTKRFLDMSMDQLKVTIITQIHAKAQIVQHKFNGVSLSVNFLFGGVVCWVMARLLLAFA